MNTLIEKICARQILDSRGIPTLEVDVYLQDGVTGSASTPSGLSTGRNEAFELRDDIRDFYGGKSVWQAVNHVNRVLSDTLRSMDVRNQRLIDETMLELDGAQDKRRLGANAILGVSLACARTAANALRIPLFQYLGGIFSYSVPVPMVNVLNGGVHADNALEIQEFMFVPQNFRSFSDSIRAVCECFYELKALLKSENLSTNAGDEGGFAPNISSHEKAFELLVSAIRKAGYVPGEQMAIAIDSAASNFFRDEKYYFQEKNRSSKDMVLLYESWIRNFPICSIEDGLAEDDWDGWFFMTELLGETVQIVGDDLFCTNQNLLRKGIQKHSANAILIKPNQVGTLSETFETIRMAKKNGFHVIVSHRSGETADPFIADLAVAVQADFIKSGSVARSERTAKYNQLLRIEQNLAQSAFTPSEEILIESI